MTRYKIASLLFVALALVAVPAARAQTAQLPERLPGDTVLYVYWRGTNSIAAARRNALMELWNDPGFGPARQLIEQGLIEGLTRNPHFAHVPPQDIQALLPRPLVAGIRLTGPGAPAKGKPKAHASGFLVVQTTGKEAEAFRAALIQAEPQAASRVRVTPAGFLVASVDPATLQNLAGRFGAVPPPASESLGALPAYREARAELTGRPPIEFFLRIPAISALRPQATERFNTTAFLDALHVERVHLLCGAIDLNAPTALLRFSILGETTPGSLFDLFGTNAGNFPTLAAAPAGASFSVYRLDLGSALSVILDAFSAAMKPDQIARVKMIAGMLSTAVMPALAGEYATAWPRPSGPGGSRVPLYAVTIHREAADQLFATTLAPFVRPAGQQGDIRYYRTVPRGAEPPAQAGKKEQAKPGAKGAQKAPPSKPSASPAMFIALTPHVLLVSRNEALVRRAARVVTAATPPDGLAADPRFRAARAELPAELSGLTFLDFAGVRWTSWLESMAKEMAKNKKDPRAAERAAALEKWAREGGGAVLARHLHWLVIGSWKNGNGVHWRGNIR